MGTMPFEVKVRRIFETGKEAHDWETRFLKRVDAKRNPMFINQHNNNGKCLRVGTCGPRGPLKKARNPRGPQTETTKAKMRKTINSSSHVSKRMRQYRVINPEGLAFEGTNLSAFCRENGLCGTRMSIVCNQGRLRSHKGWTGTYV